jgi:hypothetical protein
MVLKDVEFIQTVSEITRRSEKEIEITTRP